MSKLDRIIISSDDSHFLDYWPIVSFAWSKIIPEAKVTLALVANWKLDDPRLKDLKRYGDVVMFDHIHRPKMPHANEAKLARHFLSGWYAKDNPTIMIEDIDVIPLNKEYFRHLSRGYRKGELLCVGADVYKDTAHIGKFPMSNVTADSHTFWEIWNPTGLYWLDFLRSFSGSKVFDEKEDPFNPRQSYEAGAFSDESLLRAILHKWNKPQRIKHIDRGFDVRTQAIDRAWWGIDRDKLFNHKFIEVHGPRPFSDFKHDIAIIWEYLRLL